MIELREGRYVVGVWSVSNGSTRAWKCVAYKDLDSGSFKVAYRFSHGINASVDRDTGFLEIETDSDEQTIINSVDNTASFLISRGFGHLQRKIEIRSADPNVVRPLVESESRIDRSLTFIN